MAKDSRDRTEAKTETDEPRDEKRPRHVITNESVPSYYTNTIDMAITLHDIRFRLGELLEATSDKIVVRHLATVYMSPTHAKEFSRLLAENVKGYEEQFGEIPIKPR